MREIKSCPVCSNIPSKIYDGEQRVIVAMFHNQRTGNIGLIIASEKDSITVDVAFCPWCGRDLRRTSNG